MDKTLAEYQKEFDRLAQETLLALGPHPSDEDLQLLRYWGMATLTGLSSAAVGELAEVAYECAGPSSGARADRLAEMFFRGFVLARFAEICRESEEVDIACMN